MNTQAIAASQNASSAKAAAMWSQAIASFQQRRPHALEHVRRRQGQRHRLQPGRQHRDRVEHRGDRREAHQDAPGQRLGARAVAEDQRHHAERHRPAHQQQRRHEGDQHRPHGEQAEVVEHPGEPHRRQHAHQHAHHAHDGEPGHQLARAQGRDEDVAEVAAPDLLQEGDGEAHLAAERDLPQQHAAEQHPGRDTGSAGDAARRAEARAHARAAEIGGDEAPDEHLEHRPVHQFEEPRPGAAVKREVAVDEPPDAPQCTARHAGTESRGGGGRRRGRGRCRGTPLPGRPARSVAAAPPGCPRPRPGPASASGRGRTAAPPRPCCARRAGWSSRFPPGSAPARCAPSRRCRDRGSRWARRAAAARAGSPATSPAPRASSARPRAGPPGGPAGRKAATAPPARRCASRPGARRRGGRRRAGSPPR